MSTHAPPCRPATELVLAAVVILVVVIALAGCQGGPNPADTAKLRDRAQAALAHWADAVSAAGGKPRIVPVGELTSQVGDWELAIGDNN